MRPQAENVNENIRRGYVYAYGEEAKLHVVAFRDLEPPILSEKKQTDNEEIRQLAYHFWQQRRSPTDSSEEDWYRAEQEVVASNGKSRAAHHV